MARIQKQKTHSELVDDAEFYFFTNEAEEVLSIQSLPKFLDWQYKRG